MIIKDINLNYRMKMIVRIMMTASSASKLKEINILCFLSSKGVKIKNKDN